MKAAILGPMAVAMISASAGTADAQTLLPHRAIYDLTLIEASDRSGIAGVSGRMVYEFNGSACDGYTVSFRSVTEFLTREAARLVDQQVATFENPQSDLFTFVTKSYIDRTLDKEVKGTARDKADDGIEVELEKPDEGTVDLGQAKFPAAHMIDLLQRAKRGERFFETTIFDGTDDGDEVLTTTIVVGDRKPAKSEDGELAVMGDLSGEEFWPVSIAYFDDPNPEGEGLPIYRIDFKLYESGIARDFTTDYGDFSIRGKLVELDLLQAQNCE